MGYRRKTWAGVGPARWLRVLLLSMALGAGVTPAGCRGATEAQPDLTVAHEIAPQPPVVGPATVTLQVTNAEGRAVAGAKVELEGNMSHPGMAPIFAEAVEVAPGRYRASLKFTMSGDWVLLVNLTLPDGRRLQRQVDVRGVQSSHR